MNREERRKNKGIEKLPFETVMEKRQREHSAILNAIISQTMTRDLGLSEEEYLKKIGFGESGKDEVQAHRISMYNIVLEMQKTILSMEREIEKINGTFEAFVLEKGMTERETKEEFEKRIEEENINDGK